VVSANLSSVRAWSIVSAHFVSWLLRYFYASGRILKQQVPLRRLLHCRFQHDMCVTHGPSGQIALAHLVIHGLKIQRSNSCQNSFTQIRSDVPPQDALVVLVRLLS
jgi:hypothetical protein